MSLHHSVLWDQCPLVLATFSELCHRFNKRHMFTCYKSSCSDNLLTQSCLLIPVSHSYFSGIHRLVTTSFSHVFVRYSQSYVLKGSFPHLFIRYLQHYKLNLNTKSLENLLFQKTEHKVIKITEATTGGVI